jgi:hypothetical protein
MTDALSGIRYIAKTRKKPKKKAKCRRDMNPLNAKNAARQKARETARTAFTKSMRALSPIKKQSLREMNGSEETNTLEGDHG